jgi:hypothetical protein
MKDATFVDFFGVPRRCRVCVLSALWRVDEAAMVLSN